MRSRKGARWAIFTIQDVTGIQELLAFPESFARLEQVLKPGKPLLMKVRVQVEESGTRLSLQEARLLEEMSDRSSASVFRVRVDLKELSEDALNSLEELFEDSPGNCQVVFELCHSDGSVAVLKVPQRVASSPELAEAVRQICGEHAVVMVAA